MRTLLAIVFGIGFVLLLVLTTLALSLRSFVFDTNFYVDTLRAKGVFQQLEQNPLGLINLADQIPQLNAIPVELQQRVATIILPPGWVEKQAATAIAAWLNWFVSGETGATEIPIDLRQIKDRLQGPPGQQVATEVVNAIPTCATDQLPQLSLTQLPQCLPPIIDRAAIIEQVTVILSNAAGQMPSQYDIGPRLVAGARFGLTLNGRRIGVAMLDTSLLLLAVVTLGVGLMGALLGGREARGRWLWFGGMLLTAAVIIVAGSVFAYVFGGALLPRAWFADLTAEAGLLAAGVAQAMVQQLAARSLIGGGILLIVALIVLVWGNSRPLRYY